MVSAAPSKGRATASSRPCSANANSSAGAGGTKSLGRRNASNGLLTCGRGLSCENVENWKIRECSCKGYREPDLVRHGQYLFFGTLGPV